MNKFFRLRIWSRVYIVQFWKSLRPTYVGSMSFCLPMMYVTVLSIHRPGQIQRFIDTLNLKLKRVEFSLKISSRESECFLRCVITRTKKLSYVYIQVYCTFSDRTGISFECLLNVPGQKNQFSVQQYLFRDRTLVLSGARIDILKSTVFKGGVKGVSLSFGNCRETLSSYHRVSSNSLDQGRDRKEKDESGTIKGKKTVHKQTK